MKATGLEVLRCDAGWRDYYFLKLSTDDGITDWREFDEGFGSPGITTVIERELGEDSLVVEHPLADHPRREAGAGRPSAESRRRPDALPPAELTMTLVPPPSAKWDEEIAGELIGCLVVVGITYAFPDGSLSDQHQLFGHVVAADQRDGIELRLAGRYAGKKYRLPPDTTALRRAPPGQYQLKSTTDVVSNPDYTCAWTIEAPKN